ncbi:MAG: AraC family transcriptional activator FtrA [Cryomorphaceae bacterium]|jgi:AraC family transcriptional activator FtrA
MHNVAILTYQNAALFELGCAVELFGLARPEFDAWYDTAVVCFESGPLSTNAGLQLMAKKINSLESYDTLVIPSWPTNIAQIKGPLADQVKEFSLAGKRILSFCSGSFMLATLGLLDGRKATTHWRYADKFKRRFPSVDYVEDVLYVLESCIGCSAGSAAAIDLGIEVIRQDFGFERANQVARRLVMSAHRKGGQSQFVETPVRQLPSLFIDTVDWALSNLNTEININHLADRSHMSRRTFDRKFRQSFGTSPKEWLITQRLNVARQLLEDNTNRIQTIATHSGFDSAASMRHHFRRSLGVSPRQYRDQFGSLTKHLK